MAPPRDHSWLHNCSQSQTMFQGAEPHSIKPLTYEELREYTNDFDRENYIGKSQFGRVYHGIIESDWAAPRPVTVKIWEIPFHYYCYVEGHSEMRMMDEVVLLRHEMLNYHHGLMKLYGYCFEGEYVGVVYDFESKDILQNLIIEDDFTWLDRVKVALGFADLLVFLHTENYQNGPFVIRNIEPSHIIVDKDYNPKLYDFGLIAGGIFAHTRDHTKAIFGCFGSMDYPSRTHGFTPKTDVHNFGLLLIKLMSKCIDNMDEVENVKYWAGERVLLEYEGSDSSTMHTRSMVAPSLQGEETFSPEDGIEMSKLAYECVGDDIPSRPTMKQVLVRLLKLEIVEKYHDKLGMDRIFMKIEEEL